MRIAPVPLAFVACALGCKAEARAARVADLQGAVVEVAVQNGALVARLDARGCPALPPEVHADVGGVALRRVEPPDGGATGEALGCAGAWEIAQGDVPAGDLVVTIADASGKLVVETRPLTKKSGFRLTSRASLAGLSPGQAVFVEAYGPAAAKLLRAEVTLTTRKGQKLKLPAEQVTVGAGSVGFSLPASIDARGGAPATVPAGASGEITVSAEGDGVLRCEGPARCAAPVRAATDFAVTIAADAPGAGQK
ncbi:MAG TPA: hypothetical protein VHB21_04720 [Minicystis sp.]|nr:hypothetical protein [Minicystis sp.]